jgi:selenocysteine lyase/cysteine desulfurase
VLDHLDRAKFAVGSPREPIRRSTLVFISHKRPERNRWLHARLKEQGVDVAYRRGMLRLAPHLYNTVQDLDRTLALLHSG